VTGRKFYDYEEVRSLAQKENSGKLAKSVE